MPELPDIRSYLVAIERQFVGQRLQRIFVKSPFLLRTFEPPLEAVEGQTLMGVSRFGKQLVFRFEGELFLVLHLMVAGRLHLRPAGRRPTAKTDLAAFQFADQSLMLTEASPKKRAALHVVRGGDHLETFDRKGLDILTAPFDEFRELLARENHTLKRALTDPRLLDGIGNAYSDEILHRAQLSPLLWTGRLGAPQWQRLYIACREVLQEWIGRLEAEAAGKWPNKVTAFRPEMAVHGKFGEPCPVCQTTVQRIRYSDNETNYCPRCQTDGKLLADRSLSRLLKNDWPKTIDEWEAGKFPD